MRKQMARLFETLKGDVDNDIVFYRDNVRHRKTWSEFGADIDSCARRLERLKRVEGVRTLGILGPTSYEWCVIDLASIRAGIKSVALPESLAIVELRGLLERFPVDVLLIDGDLEPRLGRMHPRQLAYRRPGDGRFEDLPEGELPEVSEDDILEEYSLAFSSGTSENIKVIPLKFHELESDDAGRSPAARLRRIGRYLRHRRSFWSRRDNRMILFMPFSHPQQRIFLVSALFNKVSVVLSDPRDALKHVILEKPNIMVGVPLFYELLAGRVERRLARLAPWQRAAMRVYHGLSLHLWSDRRLVKRAFDRLLFHDVRKLLGGRPDYFVTGSAGIDPAALRTFLRIGVRIYEGYGQSELGTIALNTERAYRIGSVGRPVVDVRIAGDSEILVRFDEERHDRRVVDVDGDGFVHTGDLGHLDEDGFLFVHGRRDEVIVLASGKKVFPGTIESRIKDHVGISDVMVLSRDGRGLEAIVRVLNPRVEGRDEAVSAIIREVNGGLADFEKVRRFLVTDEGFTVANGLLTGTLKMRRKAIARRYSASRFEEINATALA